MGQFGHEMYVFGVLMVAPRINSPSQRGLRQGDPLSPYLFLICGEGFSSLLKVVKTNKSITGVRIARHAPLISHLFFADDNILFFQANNQEVGKVKEIIEIYEREAGQR